VLVHGFPLDGRMWRPQAAALADIRRVLTPHLDGHGRRAGLPAGRTMDEIATSLAAWLDEMDVGAVDLGGFSMGGYVAFAFCRLYPDRVRSLALVDSRAAADTEAGREGRDKLAAAIGKEGAGAAADAMLPKMFTESIGPAVRDEVAGWMREQPPAALVADVLAMRDRPDSTPTLAGLQVPVLVVHGDQDPIIPIDEAATMAGVPAQGRLVVIDAAAHLSPLEQPEAVNRALRDHLEASEAT
jgi:pimeloyl-ACP methyl ester carboxylesterase